MARERILVGAAAHEEHRRGVRVALLERKLGEAGGEAQGAMKQLAESSLQRLKNWDISDEQVKALARSGEVRRTLTFRSPVAGVVTEKKAVQGMRFMPGETLFQIADTGAVWVLADVFEQDIAAVNVGQRAKITINAYPGEVFEGRIAYVYPTLKAETRTVPVRIELANPKGKLKPAMFADVDIPAGGAAPVLTVPASAVIDSGARQTVVVQLGEGRFEPRAVKLGQRGGEFVQVLEGVREGEMVVSSANFLIDAESNQVIGAAVDEQSAGFTERFSKYGSAEEAFKFWAERIVAFMDQAHGVKQK